MKKTGRNYQKRVINRGTYNDAINFPEKSFKRIDRSLDRSFKSNTSKKRKLNNSNINNAAKGLIMLKQAKIEINDTFNNVENNIEKELEKYNPLEKQGKSYNISSSKKENIIEENIIEENNIGTIRNPHIISFNGINTMRKKITENEKIEEALEMLRMSKDETKDVFHEQFNETPDSYNNKKILNAFNAFSNIISRIVKILYYIATSTNYVVMTILSWVLSFLIFCLKFLFLSLITSPYGIALMSTVLSILYLCDNSFALFLVNCIIKLLNFVGIDKLRDYIINYVKQNINIEKLNNILMGMGTTFGLQQYLNGFQQYIQNIATQAATTQMASTQAATTQAVIGVATQAATQTATQTATQVTSQILSTHYGNNKLMYYGSNILGKFLENKLIAYGSSYALEYGPNAINIARRAIGYGGGYNKTIKKNKKE